MSAWSLPLLGPLAWIDVIALAWLLANALSVLYVALDARHTPETRVMKWAWALVAAYTGPIGAGLYILTDKEPRPGTHEEFIRPLWKQGVGSAVHCIAGDATGIIFAATVTALLGFPMWIDIIIEYVFGFTFGLLIFQALFMRTMFNGSYVTALKHSFVPEWLSMNMMMTGMVLIMVPNMMGRDMRAMDPGEVLFWGVMSAGVSVGFVISYPVNVWLVQVKLKHGLATERKATRAPAPQPAGERQPEAGQQPAARPAHEHGGA